MRTKQLDNETALQGQKYEAERKLKHEEFQIEIEAARIQKQTAIELKQLELSKPTTVPVAQQNIYVHRLPFLSSEDSLPVFLSRFEDSMRAALVPDGQWIARLSDILTGRVLKTFKELLDSDKLSFDVVKSKLLAAQNYTAESMRQLFHKLAPLPDQSFSV